MQRNIRFILPLLLASCLAAPSAWASITATKSFSPSTIAVGQTSTLTITIQSNGVPNNTGNLSFTDNYPAGLVNAAVPAVTNTCGGTITAAAGGNSLKLTGSGRLTGVSSCTITVQVTSSTVGAHINTVRVNSTGAGSSTSSATLTVVLVLVGSFNAFETSTAAGAISGRIYTKLAGVSFSLDVVAINAGAQSVSFTAAVTVDLLGNSATGVALDAQNCPTSYTVLQTVTPNPTITGGRSTVNFAAVPTAWQDVRVRIRYPTAAPTVTSCSTDNFAIRPQAFTVTSTNATNLNKTGSPILAAGAAVLNLTATAVVGYNGTPLIDNTKIVGSPVAGAIGGAFSAAPVATGVAVGNAFNYSEVGNFGLNADAIYDSSFTGVDQPGDCNAGFSDVLSGGKYGCGIGSTAVPLTIGASGFGRFIPDHFDTVVSQVAGVPMNCANGLTCPTLYNGMVYSGQAFTLSINAKNAAGVMTKNYDNTAGYSRQVTLSAASAIGGAISAAGSISSGATVPAASFVSGTASPTPAFTFTTTPASPTNIYLRATDTDGATSLLPAPNSASSVEGGVAVVSGRISISNAYGSELLKLPVYVSSQYWNGTAWVTSNTDSATALNASLVSSSNWTNLTPGNWQKLFPASAWAAGATSVVPATAVFTLVNGVGNFTLAAPGAGNVGSVDITPNAPAYLLPANTARATFGVYKGNLNFIYQREN